MAEIIPFNCPTSSDAPPAPSAEPNQELIDRLEGMLESARSGQLQGIAFAFINADWSRHTGWIGGDRYSSPLASAVMTLHWRYGQSLAGD